jgi:hypothetical protein
MRRMCDHDELVVEDMLDNDIVQEIIRQNRTIIVSTSDPSIYFSMDSLIACDPPEVNIYFLYKLKGLKPPMWFMEFYPNWKNIENDDQTRIFQQMKDDNVITDNEFASVRYKDSLFGGHPQEDNIYYTYELNQLRPPAWFRTKYPRTRDERI